MKRAFTFGTVAAAVVMLGAGGVQASSVFVGNMANWMANPSQFANDKTFIYVDSTGGWTGAELVTISSNIPQNSESVSIDGLSNYIGPQNLMVAYQVVISSSDVFGTISLDQNFSGATATTYKDIFASLADLEANPTPGSGTWALSVINGAAARCCRCRTPSCRFPNLIWFRSLHALPGGACCWPGWPGGEGQGVQRRCGTRWLSESRLPSRSVGRGLTVDSEPDLPAWPRAPSCFQVSIHLQRKSRPCGVPTNP